MIDLAALRAPFQPHEHSWRAQQVARDGNRAQALVYITSRAVQNRLDDVCQPDGWEGRFAETASGRVIATISICFGERWVAKSDGAGATAMEGVKGGLSDAFKRAAVMWGIGRYLYDLPQVWAECDVIRESTGDMRLRNGKPIWRKWTDRGECQLNEALRGLFARMEGRTPHPTTPRLPAPDPIDLTPQLQSGPLRLGVAPAFRQPLVVKELIDGLPLAMREGNAERYWADHYRNVPDMWRPFVIAEKDRLRREAGL